MAAGKDALDVLGLGGVTDQEPMLAECPQLTGVGPRSARRLLEGRVEVEGLGSFGLLSGLQAAEQVTDFVVAEAGEADVDVGTGRQIGQEAGEELLVPGA